MWHIAEQSINSRLVLGTAQFPNLQTLLQAIALADTEIITVSLARFAPQVAGGNAFWQALQQTGCRFLPNTAGCRSAKQAITMAQMAREIFQTNWLKLEVIGDDYNLQPDPVELLIAADALVKQGFVVWAYTTDDLVICQRLRDCGCLAIMPWASPIGSGQGILNPRALEMLRERLPDATLIIDAGIGAPSDAARVMEMGYDAVLLNSAVALAQKPAQMAQAFAAAIHAGRLGFEAGIIPRRSMASPSTPLIDTPFWHQVPQASS